MEDKIDSSMIGPGQASLFRSNEQIRDDVVELIQANDLVQPKDVDVSVEDGVVTLSGKVDTQEAKDAAEDAAHEVLGVIAVRNELEMAA